MTVGGSRAQTPAQASGMTDVAKLAGVSSMTVSRVLNGHPHVRAQTRERVLDAIRRLDYRPSSAARTLVTRRSNTFGLITTNSALFGPTSMVYGFEQAARAASYFVTIASLTSLTPKAVIDAMNRLREQAVDGVAAIVPQDSGAAALRAAAPGIPVIALGGYPAADLPAIGVENAAGAAMVTEHLLELGHPTVHHIAGPVTWPEARERRAGWQRALQAAGTHVPHCLVGDWTARSGYELGRHLARNPSVTAIFCANDHMALGVLRALAEAGRRVPADVSVAGFDDIPDAQFMIPPLTTARQDFTALGRLGVDLLRELVADTEPIDQRRIRLTPSLITRRSTANPPLRTGAATRSAPGTRQPPPDRIHDLPNTVASA